MEHIATADVNSSTQSAPRFVGWAVWLKITTLTGLVVMLYARVLANLAQDWWNDPSVSHGMLIPPFALYLAWVRRRSILATPLVPDGRGLVLVAAACMTFLVGLLGAEFFLTRFSFVMLLAALVWTFWGLPRLKMLAFPLVLLVTMIPLPLMIYNALASPLQLFASEVATGLVRMLGVTVFRDGNVIHLAGISLGVAEACSGLRSLVSLMTAALLVGFLRCTRFITRTVVFLLAVPIAIAFNVLRITGTALIADHNQDYAFGYYHSFSGWLIFIAGFGVILLAANLLHRVWD